MVWLAAGGLLAASATLGCGNQYKPVVTSVNQTGPAGQPSAYAVVTSQPGYNLLNAPANNPCMVSDDTAPNVSAPTTYANPGIVTLINTSGDSIVNQALIGNGPLTLALDPSGGVSYVPNCDGTMSYFDADVELQTKDIETSSFINAPEASANAIPTNVLAMNGAVFVTEKGHNAIAEMTGAPPAVVQEIQTAPSLINLVGVNQAQRIYGISQGNSNGGNLAWGACSDPSSVTVDGEADGLDLDISSSTKGVISVANQSISSRIPLGVCPVYGVMSNNGERAFIMNRGSGTVTVIDAQKNTLDTSNNGYLTGNGTINLCGGASPCNAGPVYAAIYNQGQELVTANYDNNTISIIDISQDIYGNDSATFGKVIATVKVGEHPDALTILADGSRVYVADQGTTSTSNGKTVYNDDGAVTIVNLNNDSVTGTIPIDANPREIASVYNYPIGKVLVASPNSSFITVIRTDTDSLAATIQVQGNVTSLRTSTQYAGASSSAESNNSIIESRSSGSGQP